MSLRWFHRKDLVAVKDGSIWLSCEIKARPRQGIRLSRILFFCHHRFLIRIARCFSGTKQQKKVFVF